MTSVWPNEKNIFAQFYEKNISLKLLPQFFETKINIVSLKQIHSGNVVTITKENQKNSLEGDALVTTLDNTALTVHTADCLPLLGFGGDVIGACHAGWKGITQRIIESWINEMVNLGAKKDHIKIAMGPAIGPCHFEVGADVAKTLVTGISEKLLSTIKLKHPNPDKNYISIRELARYKLMHMGINVENIVISEECTYCHPSKYHSYRRDGAQNGQRLEALIVKARH